jgi:hypothetical protein
MKKIILTLGLFMSMGTFAQLEVSTSESTVLYQNIQSTKLVEFNSDGNVFYALYYRDTKYTYITEIKYISLRNKEEVIQFLELSEKVLETKEKFSTSKYSLSKVMGSVLVIGENGGTFYMTKNVIEKLKESLKRL